MDGNLWKPYALYSRASYLKNKTKQNAIQRANLGESKCLFVTGLEKKSPERRALSCQAGLKMQTGFHIPGGTNPLPV